MSSPMCDFSEVVNQQSVNTFRRVVETETAAVDFICRDNVDGTRLLIHLRCCFLREKYFNPTEMSNHQNLIASKLGQF